MPFPQWQLLAKFYPTAGLVSQQRVVTWVVDFVRELGLQPLQVERVQAVVAEYLRNDNQSRILDSTPASIRIWITNKNQYDQSRSSPNVLLSSGEKSRGYGIFFIEMVTDNQTEPAQEKFRVLDLLIYGE